MGFIYSMEKYIINSFFYKKRNDINYIFEYIKQKYDTVLEINDIKMILKNYIKLQIIDIINNNYYLTTEGNVILMQCKNYYSRIITEFFIKYFKLNKKKYCLKEVRIEQQKLRGYLINNRSNICVICDKKLPLCLLETAHLKPRYLLSYAEKIDINVAEFMCRYCHNLYDNGFLGISNGLLCVSPIININEFDLDYIRNKNIICYNERNKKYFDYHYKNIYNKNIINLP